MKSLIQKLWSHWIIQIIFSVISYILIRFFWKQFVCLSSSRDTALALLNTYR
jgi:ABC-type Fe3+-siderophore transport system permease subunit